MNFCALIQTKKMFSFALWVVTDNVETCVQETESPCLRLLSCEHTGCAMHNEVSWGIGAWKNSNILRKPTFGEKLIMIVEGEYLITFSPGRRQAKQALPFNYHSRLFSRRWLLVVDERKPLRSTTPRSRINNAKQNPHNLHDPQTFTRIITITLYLIHWFDWTHICWKHWLDTDKLSFTVCVWTTVWPVCVLVSPAWHASWPGTFVWCYISRKKIHSWMIISIGK